MSRSNRAARLAAKVHEMTLEMRRTRSKWNKPDRSQTRALLEGVSNDPSDVASDVVGGLSLAEWYASRMKAAS